MRFAGTVHSASSRSISVHAAPAHLAAAGRREDEEPEGQLRPDPGVGAIHGVDGVPNRRIRERGMLADPLRVAPPLRQRRAARVDRVVGPMAFRQRELEDRVEACLELDTGLALGVPQRGDEHDHVGMRADVRACKRIRHKRLKTYGLFREAAVDCADYSV